MLTRFHPLVAEWFRCRFETPTEPQSLGWREILARRDTLIAAPTGSGKTLAAFLAALDSLVGQGVEGCLPDQTQVLYVSPLKALSNDIQKNLRQPLREIQELAGRSRVKLPEIRVAVRTGDTPTGDRQRMIRRPPHILITTPESLFILLTAEKSRRILRDVRTVIVDEIHALARDKRGSHLALSLARLEALTPARPIRIGLSATQRPIEEIARFLVGQGNPDGDGEWPCRVIDVGHRRAMELAVEVPRSELGAVTTNEMWEEIYNRLTELIRAHRSTLVFVNTRRMAERVGHHLAERLGEDAVATHHGSLSRRIRLTAEDRLKHGQAKAVVATASLELGIDVGSVDLVCQIGSPRSIALGLQRVGRSGHWRGAIPKGRLFATTRDDLLECAALVRAIRQGELDRIEIRCAPLDILSQHLVAATACEEWNEESLFDLCRRAFPYRHLSREDFRSVLEILAEGFSTRRGRSGAYIHWDRVHHRLRGRRGARLAAITSGGAIPDNANYLVVADPEETVVGNVDEDFAVESLAGDIFLLGNTSWRIRRVEAGRVRVEDAHGAAPTIPFWRGEAPSRTSELSAFVSDLREEIARQTGNPKTASSWLEGECGLDRSGAEQAFAYVAAGRAALDAVPTRRRIIAERFFDEGGGMQLIVHSPLGGRLNRAWGLALRKRFCRTFNFELQAAATDNGLVLSLGEQHSFPLETVSSFLHSNTVRDVLTQALLASPMFTTRWRWNATRFLALLRFSRGRKVPMPFQRMRAEDLMAAVFPGALACPENLAGEIPIPNHPFIHETLHDCLTEAMDLEGLTVLLRDLEAGRIEFRAVDTPEPSPFCHEILNANPYAFLDDAPLEERRARAVTLRRTLPAELGSEMGQLDPAVIEQVTEEAWASLRSAANPDELHDGLLSVGWLPESVGRPWENFFAALAGENRATRASALLDGSLRTGWVAAERLLLVCTAFPEVTLNPSIAAVHSPAEKMEAEEAIAKIVCGWLEHTGPTTVAALAELLPLRSEQLEAALGRLEASGQVLRGHFRPGVGELEWCDRHLLARIHRMTLGRLRREVEPVSAADFLRFLLRWQHVAPGTKLHGEAGLMAVIRQLGGFEVAAAAWESDILSNRIAGYDPQWLDRLCLAGEVGWARLSPHPASVTPSGPESGLRSTLLEPEETAAGSRKGTGRRIIPTRLAPITLFAREEMPWLFAGTRKARHSRDMLSRALSPPAQDVFQCLSSKGASFFNDLVRGTGRLKAEVEQALWELVMAGLVTADGFDNLRALVDAKRRRAEGRGRTARPRHSTGRWSILAVDEAPQSKSAVVERAARQLLDRYGVVFHKLVSREALTPSWHDLLQAYRRWEAQGRIRAGRFVAGFTGEQFALPEAVEALRALRRVQPAGEQVTLSACDPLNLIGVILPGDRTPSLPEKFIRFRDGVPMTLSATEAEAPAAPRPISLEPVLALERRYPR